MKDKFEDMNKPEKRGGFWLFRYSGENAVMIFLKIIVWLIIIGIIRFIFAFAFAAADEPNVISKGYVISINDTHTHLQEVISDLDKIEAELDQFIIDNMVSQNATGEFRHFNDYTEMRTWFESAVKKVGDRNNQDKLREIQLMALNEGIIFSIAPTNRLEQYDYNTGIRFVKLRGSAIAGNTIYFIYFSDYNDQAVYYSVGNVGGNRWLTKK